MSSAMPRISESGEHEGDSKTSSTTTAEAARRRAENYIYRGTQMDGLDVTALEQLPPSMLVCPKRRHRRPKRYHFGFGVSLHQLHDYCVAQDLAPKHYHGKLLYHNIMVSKAVREIGRRCGARLYLRNIWNGEHEWVLARYSNYTWCRERMPDHDEQLAADVIRRELCTCEAPKWFWQY